MATSPNYAWAEPDNSSLVKNGAADIRTLGDAIDTSVWNVGYGQAGKNKIINGDFGVWQRGTSFSNPASGAYTADRFCTFATGSGITQTVSQQTFTPASAPVAGYEGTYFLRNVIAGTVTGNKIIQRIENVRVFAGQAATISFWAKADTARTVTVYLDQYFGSGGSAAANGLTPTAVSVTTSWARYTVTGTVASISGKTVGTSSYLSLEFSLAAASTLDLWGIQLEAGSVATAFQTATGTIQGELAACQRYYWRTTANSTYTFAQLNAGIGVGNNANTASLALVHPVTMRTLPSPTIEYGGTIALFNGGSAVTGITLTMDSASPQTTRVSVTKTASFAASIPYTLSAWGDAAAYIGLSAEL